MSKSKLTDLFKRLDKGVRTFEKYHPVLSTAASIGTVGAGAAALVSLIRDLKTSMEEKKRKEELAGNSIDPETIVLHVRKRAEDESMNCTPEACSDPADPTICKAQEGEHDSVVRTESQQDHEMPVGSHATTGLQRDLHGQFTDSGEKQASTGFLSRTAQILAGVGAGAGGYYLIRALHDKIEQNRLKKQIAAAQKEYLSLIDGSEVKNAEAVNSLFLIGDPMFGHPAEKQAGVISSIYDLIGNQSKNVTAAMLASYIMAGLGAGYVTKRVLENKFDKEEEEEEPRKIRRIVFKTAPDPATKAASAEEFEVGPDLALASLGILMNCMESSDDPMSKRAADYGFLRKVTSTPEGRQWLLDVYARGRGMDRDVDPSNLPNMGAMDKLKYARTLIGLRNNPDAHMDGVRGYVMDLMRSNPKAWYESLGDERNKDLVSLEANEALSKALSNKELGSFASLPGIRHIISGLGHLYFNTGAGRNKAISKMLDFTPEAEPVKAASILDNSLSDMSAMLSRATVLSDKRNTDLDKKLDKILETLPAKKRKPKASETEVESEGDDADEYVLQNGREIARILNAMKEKGLVA